MMPKIPLSDITVVIPAYNAAAFIHDALDSVKRQTVPPSEIIVVDDGSTDSTSILVAQWIRIHGADISSPVRLVNQENQGVATARNLGIARASSTWIALLDADDIWEANHIEQLLAAVGLNSSAVGAYGAGRLTKDGVLNERLYDDFWDNPSKKLGLPTQTSTCYLIDFNVFPRLMRGNFIKPSSLMFYRQSALDIGGFNVTLKSAEDREFLVRLLRKGALVYSEIPITLYRWHDENLSQTKNAKRNLANGLCALKVIGENPNLDLDSDQKTAWQLEVGHISTEYLYACACAGVNAYVAGLRLIANLFGMRASVFGISTRHIARGILASIRNRSA